MIRFKGIEIEEPRAGRFYLVRVVRGSRETYQLYDEPGRFNMSHAECTKGWLGETNNVSRYAEGAVELTEIAGKKWKLRKIDAAVIMRGEEVEVVRGSHEGAPAEC